MSRCDQCGVLLVPKRALQTIFGPDATLSMPKASHMLGNTFGCPTCVGSMLADVDIGAQRLGVYECSACACVMISDHIARELAPRLDDVLEALSGERPIRRSSGPVAARSTAGRTSAPRAMSGAPHPMSSHPAVARSHRPGTSHRPDEDPLELGPRKPTTRPPPEAIASMHPSMNPGTMNDHVRRRMEVHERAAKEASLRPRRMGRDSGRMEIDGRIEVAAIPVALFLGLVLSFVGEGIVVFPVRLWFHELGHALLAWTSGRAALPLPFGFTFWSEQPSLFTSCCYVFLLLVMGAAGIRERRPFPIALSGSLLFAHIVMGWIMAPDSAIEWILVGGLAGELAISTLLVAAFYFPMPDKTRWDFWRFLVLVPAAAAFASAARMWMRVAQGVEAMPMGSIMGNDESGDLNRLITDYAWTSESITRFYCALSVICGAILLAVVTSKIALLFKEKEEE